jgi:hypothetical protein
MLGRGLGDMLGRAVWEICSAAVAWEICSAAVAWEICSAAVAWEICSAAGTRTEGAGTWI